MYYRLPAKSSKRLPAKMEEWILIRMPMKMIMMMMMRMTMKEQKKKKASMTNTIW